MTHHPFDLPDGEGQADLVGRARRAIDAFAQCGVDLLLAGHFHTSQSGGLSDRHDVPGYSALVVQAGTATSTRSRGETNSFNVLRVEAGAITVEQQAWRPEAKSFAAREVEHFRRERGIWVEHLDLAQADAPK